MIVVDEVSEAIVAVVLDRFTEELRARQYAVVVLIGADEPFAIERPLVAGDPSVTIAIDARESASRPIVELAFVVVGNVAVLPARANADLIARQHAVAVPIVHAER